MPVTDETVTMQMRIAAGVMLSVLLHVSVGRAAEPAAMRPLASSLESGIGPATANREQGQAPPMIYVTHGGLRADYYDNEGHVIRYGIQSPGNGQAVFLSDPVPGEPRYRLTYRQLPGGMLEGTFELAAPGSADFKPYLTWQSRKTM